MRILMLGQFFTPEPDLKGLPFARELRRRGHEVEVLTGFPNYPGGKIYPGYSVRPWRREIIDGITVNRVALYPSHDRSAVGRTANYASFALCAAAFGPFRVKRPDVVYVYHPPATVALPAAVLRAWYGCPLVYDVQDLWPDSVLASGMIGNRWFEAALGRWCRWVYSTMDRIVVLAPGMRDTLIERGVAAEKIDVIYNWADEASLRCPARDPQREKDLGMTGRFNVVFAGTMGLVQKLDTVLEAAQLRHLRAGRAVPVCRRRRRQDSVGTKSARHATPQHAIRAAAADGYRGAILAAADVLLVHLKDDPLFRITIPSKTQASLATGRPVLMAVAGDAAHLVEQSGGGVTCPSENPTALAEAVRQLRIMDRPQREAIGAKGRAFYDRYLSLTVGAEKFERVFELAVKERRAKRGGTGPGSRVSSAPAKPSDHAP